MNADLSAIGRSHTQQNEWLRNKSEEIIKRKDDKILVVVERLGPLLLSANVTFFCQIFHHFLDHVWNSTKQWDLLSFDMDDLIFVITYQRLLASKAVAINQQRSQFLAVQDSSITDIVCRSLGPLEPTNNQSSYGASKSDPRHQQTLVDTFERLLRDL